MKRIGNVILDLENIDSMSFDKNRLLILFKSKNSKTYSEEELGMSCYKFLDEVVKKSGKEIDTDSLLLYYLMTCNQNNGKQ